MTFSYDICNTLLKVTQFFSIGRYFIAFFHLFYVSGQFFIICTICEKLEKTVSLLNGLKIVLGIILTKTLDQNLRIYFYLMKKRLNIFDLVSEN